MVPRKQELVVVTASDYKYKHIVQKNVKNCREFGHKLVVYDLGGLGFGIKRETDKSDFEVHETDTIVRVSFKPHVILDAVEKYKLVMWVDGDAYVNRPIDFSFDFDIGVTARRRYNKNEELGFINSGVIMINRNPKSYEFVKKWAKECKGPDQKYINQMITPHIPKDEVFEDREPLDLKIEGLKIRVFPAAKYNDYQEFNEDSYVHHLKGYISKKIKRGNQGIVIGDKLKLFDI